MNLLHVSTILIIYLSNSFAVEHKYCGFDEAIEQIESKKPGFKTNIDFIYNAAKRYGNELGSRDIIYKIPVVFHIVYKYLLSLNFSI